MTLPASIPAPIRNNDDQIGSALTLSEQSDSDLAAALWECQQNRYYRVFGYRSIGEYMRERWRETDQRDVAALKARSLQRLLREYRLALEIPAFRKAFDRISRTNRRIIAQVLTLDNADGWIAAALTLSSRELEAKVGALETVSPESVDKAKRLYLSLYPGQRAIWEETKVVARRMVRDEGDDSSLLTDAMILEACCQEYLAAYQQADVPGRGGFVMTCPACKQQAVMRRENAGDQASNGSVALMFTCGLCAAPIVLATRAG